ncbi:PREDICTED: NADH dehydrogenase [ubiquinone] 1 beta subcomplex subunit 10-like [Priapulus caudatus]|uniref:NADH dehydrogenase [ubiquinone] 1 beta subcomplex subunit 10 n=1 Tax=Priapulus caudatus TaxID=37621 RepID=A0ABM1EAQ6_PRICU|nr:PREDICTED: NADH dehydrogenase [ubiquinone] 1 beta subcomplex subunit 10-like [Priapulus caudatus]
MPDLNETPMDRFRHTLYKIIDTPVSLFRERVVEPNRKSYPYYHRKFKRVPNIDTCDVGDYVCFVEAHEQFRRDKLVESEILAILRQRREACIAYEGADWKKKCQQVMDDYTNAETNWFIKYGDLGAYGNVKDAYMKQKHRLIWQRRHPEIED